MRTKSATGTLLTITHKFIQGAFVFSLSIIVMVGLMGCTSGAGIATGPDHYAPTPFKNVVLLTESPDPSTYTIIGSVTAQGAPAASKNAVYAKLAKYAAHLGADAVIVTSTSRYLRGYSDFGPMYGWDIGGMAIKYKK